MSEEGGRPRFWRRWGPKGDLILTAAVTVLVGFFLNNQAWTDASVFHDNWRQSPHWIAPEKQNFQEDDPFIRYAEFNTSPFSNLLYKTLARTGYDVVWGKIVGLLFFTLTALLIYWTGYRMRNRISGLAALVVFLLFPTAIDTFVGGFMSGFSMPLLCASVLLILRKWWWGFLPLMVLQIQAYPMVAVQTGMMLVVDTLLNDRHQLWKVTWWKGKVLPFTLAAVACGGLLLGKYSGEHPQFGHLVDRTEIGDRGEFTSDGRAYLIPARPLHRYIRREWVNPFHIAVLLLSYLLLGGRIFRLPRGPSAMLLSGFLLYWLADIFMLRLYFPSRYLYRTLPLFAALTAGFWVSLIVSHHGGIKTLISTRHFRVRWSWARVVLSSFVLIGVWEFGDRLDPEYRDLPRYDKSGLYGALRELPGRPLIAAHPALASELPTLTGKSVFISEELSHPWWTEHWKLVSEHTQDFFRGYYSRDPDVLRQIIARHEIDYWVIRRRHFRRSYIRGRDFSIAPFNRWIVTALRPTTGSLLNLIPKRYLLFEDSSFALVSSANVLDWLEQRQVRVPRSAGFGGRRE